MIHRHNEGVGMYTASIITVSDSASKGERVDLSAKVLEELLLSHNFSLIDYQIVPDDVASIQKSLRKNISSGINLILTTGGTGFSKRDITPEATLALLERATPGIDEAIRQNSAKFTPRAMLSRAISGLNNNSLIVNLPGSPKACRESAGFLLDNIAHGLEILLGSATHCGE